MALGPAASQRGAFRQARVERSRPWRLVANQHEQLAYVDWVELELLAAELAGDLDPPLLGDDVVDLGMAGDTDNYPGAAKVATPWGFPPTTSTDA